MIKIKLCGIQTVADAALMNEFMPDYVGFVFAESKRKVSRETARTLKGTLDKKIRTVGVFVNDSIEKIAGLCDDGIIGLIQLHGEEDAAYISELKQSVPNEIIKAVRVKIAGDIEKANALPCDYLLFDTYDKNAHGGTGRRFDWAMLKSAAIQKPYFLAGGLNAGNIADAAKVLPAPYCLDVSSGIERGGIKDSETIRLLLQKLQTERKEYHGA